MNDCRSECFQSSAIHPAWPRSFGKLTWQYYNPMRVCQNLSLEYFQYKKYLFKWIFRFSPKITEAAFLFKVVWKPQTLKFGKPEVWCVICPPPSLCWNALRESFALELQNMQTQFWLCSIRENTFKQGIIFLIFLWHSNRRYGWFQTVLWLVNYHSLI